MPNCNTYPFPAGVSGGAAAPGGTSLALVMAFNFDGDASCPPQNFSHTISVPSGWGFNGTRSYDPFTGTLGPLVPGQPAPFTLTSHNFKMYYAEVVVSSSATSGSSVVGAPHLDEVRNGLALSRDAYTDVL